MTRTETDLASVEEILEKACGVTFSSGLRRTLQTSLARAAKACGLEPAAFAHRVRRGDADCLASLIEHSVIGETYFFRHPEQIAALADRLGHDFAQEVELRLWSAGCASGEEAYSLAMALLDLGRLRSADRILATDVSERALSLAREGIYGNWSMRRLGPKARSSHFEPSGNGVRVTDAARRRVEFRRHNLICDPAPIVQCHAIVCRNVLIYFAPETAAAVLHNLADALAPGGYLVLGPVEIPMAAPLMLEWIETKGATLLRKPDGKRAAIFGPGRRRATPPRPQRRKTSPGIAARTVPAPAKSAPCSRFEMAREAARQGKLEEAERLARGAAAEEMSPESYLLLSMAAESRGDLEEAVDCIRRALYLEPSLATGHAQLVALFRRMGRSGEAEHSRRNALRALEGLDEGTVLKGVEVITAGALRHALEQPIRR